MPRIGLWRQRVLGVRVSMRDFARKHECNTVRTLRDCGFVVAGPRKHPLPLHRPRPPLQALMRKQREKGALSDVVTTQGTPLFI